ncbi:MAG: IS982 family transposase [Alphaproteobacteria bacterium]|nr:IS982 family transposase [Alphaproteobacteria bacterium]
MIPLEEIFCFIDDFCKYFEKEQAGRLLCSLKQKRKRRRECQMSLSEVMTILVMFHYSHYRTFKDFYLNCILLRHRHDFPKALTYNRFVELMPTTFMPFIVFISALSGKQTGKYFIDSTKLPVCHNLRIYQNKVFKDYAKRGKTSTGWFFGFKLHLVFNDKGELMGFDLTTGNIDDRKVVEEMVKDLTGWLIGDKGYVSKKLSISLMKRNIELITKVKKNMKEKIINPIKKYYLNKRGMIETIIDQLKNLLHIDHSRHRSIMNFQINVLGGLLAYIFKPRKVGVPFHEINMISAENALLTSN